MQTSGDSRVLAAGIGNDLYLWRFDQVGTPQVIRGESGVTLLDGDVSSDGQLVITVDSAGEVRWWDTRAARSRAQGQHKGATTVALANGGWLAATGSGDSCVRLWARNGYDAPADLCPHDGAKIDAVRFSLDDAHLFTASDEGIFRVWDVMKARLTAGVSLRQVGFGFGYAVSADGRHAAFADFRGKVSVVDLKTVRTRELEASVPGISAQRKSFGSPTRPPYVASAIANEGKTVLVAGSDGAILKWHLARGRRLTGARR